MKIFSISPYYQNSPNFKSTNRMYFSKAAKNAFCQGEVSNFTRIFREDISDWFKLAKYIVNNFKDKDRISLYSLGCSDGSEAYSLAIAMKKFIGNKNCFPVIAVDKDINIIEHAKSGRINLSPEDIIRAEELLVDNQKYFTDMQDEVSIEDILRNVINDWDYEFPRFFSYKVDENLRNLVNFRRENLIKTVKNLKDDGNSFVGCRNVTPYLVQEDIKTLVSALKSNLKSGSLVALGDYDRRVGTDLELIKSGFSPTKINYVFRKD